MKTVRRLAATLLFCGGIASHVHADPPDFAPDSNFTIADPDATPRAFTEPARKLAKTPRPSSATDSDWLLHGYEEQLQAHAAATGRSNDNNLYSEITADKDLAKAAGLSPTVPGDDASDTLHTGAANGAPTLQLRTDAPAPAPGRTALSQMTGVNFKPFITPLNGGEMAGMQDFFSRLPASLPDVRATPDTDALDMPGMVAAQSDPNQKQNLDLTLDPLPGESLAQEREHHDLALALPTAHNSDRLQKQTDAALLAPGQRKTIAPVPISPLLLKQPESATAQMVNDPPPIRGQVNDPYDILR